MAIPHIVVGELHTHECQRMEYIWKKYKKMQGQMKQIRIFIPSNFSTSIPHPPFQLPTPPFHTYAARIIISSLCSSNFYPFYSPHGPLRLNEEMYSY